MVENALDGLKVISFATGGAGPMVSKYLGDFGAMVIRVESESSLDLSRVDGPFKNGQPGINRSGPFQLANSSQLSLSLNLKKPEAAEIVKNLTVWADVIVENYSPSTMNRLGIGYPSLQPVKPDIIMLSSSAKGQTGPHSSYRAWGLQSFTEAGYMEFIGWPDRPGVIMPNAIPDYESAWYGVIAILAALESRSHTGKGQHIDLSQTEVGISLLAPAMLDYMVNHKRPVRKGNSSERAAPHGVFPCKGEDEWCAIAVFNDEQWQILCKILEKPDLANNPKFNTLLGRMKHYKELEGIIEEWTVNYPAMEVMSRLQKEGVPAGKVQNTADLLDSDPQLKYRHFWHETYSSEIGEYQIYGSPAQLSAAKQSIKPAPKMGEHNQYICSKILKMSDEEYQALLDRGVLK
jgi:benzylsuccinate CoA-transferase BbsF subunit